MVGGRGVDSRAAGVGTSGKGIDQARKVGEKII